MIQDCRAAIAKQRNERQRQATKEKRAMAAAEMAQVITELHGRDDHPRTALEDLLSGPWRERVSYRRRREHVEREAGKEEERKRLWQETQRQRRQLKRKERARQRTRAACLLISSMEIISPANAEGRKPEPLMQARVALRT